MEEALIVTGPCGVGKSSVAFECLDLLEEAGTPAALVDAELVYFHPAPAGDPQKERVAEQALAALWPLYRAQGVERLLLARVIEKPSHLELVRRALPQVRLIVMWLDAPAAVVEERLRGREIGSALAWHVERAEEIRQNAARHELRDFTVDADRPVRETAREALSLAGWLTEGTAGTAARG